MFQKRCDLIESGVCRLYEFQDINHLAKVQQQQFMPASKFESTLQHLIRFFRLQLGKKSPKQPTAKNQNVHSSLQRSFSMTISFRFELSEQARVRSMKNLYNFCEYETTSKSCKPRARAGPNEQQSRSINRGEKNLAQLTLRTILARMRNIVNQQEVTFQGCSTHTPPEIGSEGKCICFFGTYFFSQKCLK